MTWPVGNWLGLAVLAFVGSVTFMTIYIGETFRGYRLHRRNEGRSVFWYWGPGNPPWNEGDQS